MNHIWNSCEKSTLSERNYSCFLCEMKHIRFFTHIDDAGSIHMRWENGSSLALIPEIDSFQTVSEAKK